MTRPPGQSFTGPLPPMMETQTHLADALKQHVTVLAGYIGERHIHKPDALNRCVEYLTGAMKDAGYEMRELPYECRGVTVKNLEASIPGSRQPEEIVVIAAHYDSVAGCPGANDNGSAVAAVIEMARALRGSMPQRTIRFVYFVNEEPPFFQTNEMGSMVYAKSCRARGDNIVAMLSIETIGYYRDEPGSQNYPDPIGKQYPDTGNFIAFVANDASKQLLFDAIGSFRRHAKFPSEGGAAAEWIPGVGWSDHFSFWQHNYPAIMITDTAPFRYPHYHEPTDTADKIDYPRTARVVDGIIHVIKDLGGITGDAGEK